MVTFLIKHLDEDIPAAWNYLLSMTYLGNHNDTEEIILVPYDSVVRWDAMNNPDYHLEFDYAWKHFDKKETHIMPNLKSLHVPWSLFDCVGSHSFMRERFPFCKVTYWDLDE